LLLVDDVDEVCQAFVPLHFFNFGSVRCCFHTSGQAPFSAIAPRTKGETMKNLTLSFWLALAAASIVFVQNATPFSSQVRADLPIPTCPPDCPDSK
jgi:hypothetical protein